MQKQDQHKQLNPRQAAAIDLLEWYRDGKITYRKRRDLAKQQDYALYRNLVSSVVRYREKYLFYIRTLTGRSLKKLDREVIVCLMVGIAQLDSFSGIHAYAAVNETVNLIVFLKKTRLKGFINGNLRSFQRRKDELESALKQQPLSIRTSHPEWMVKRWQEQYGSAATENMCHENNYLPKVRVVLNPAFDRSAIEADIGTSHEIVARHSEGFTLNQPSGLFDTKWADSGAFLVQDHSSQQINNLIQSLPKTHTLDACASPGGKLFHLEWRFGSEIEKLVALEISEERLERLKSNLGRFRSRALITRMDASRPGFSSLFDLVLIDAPCSGTGTIQKHPELKWQRRIEDILQNQQKQLRILNGIKDVVRDNGHLLYITCSMEKEENQDVISAFLKNNSGVFRPVPFSNHNIDQSLITKEGYFQCRPQETAMGLFAALLQKTP